MFEKNHVVDSRIKKVMTSDIATYIAEQYVGNDKSTNKVMWAKFK